MILPFYSQNQVNSNFYMSNEFTLPIQMGLLVANPFYSVCLFLKKENMICICFHVTQKHQQTVPETFISIRSNIITAPLRNVHYFLSKFFLLPFLISSNILFVCDRVISLIIHVLLMDIRSCHYQLKYYTTFRSKSVCECRFQPINLFSYLDFLHLNVLICTTSM